MAGCYAGTLKGPTAESITAQTFGD